MKRTMLMIIFCMPLVTLLGCTGSIGDNQDVLLLVAVEDNTAYYQHFEEFFADEWTPTSLWAVDLETEEARQIAPEQTYVTLMVGEDHYVYTLEPEEGKTEVRLMAVQISTEEEFEIYTWEDGDCLNAAVNGGTVAYFDKDCELVLFDLSTRSEADKIALPIDPNRLLGFQSGSVALLGTEPDVDEQQLIFVDAAEGTVTTQADLPKGGLDCALKASIIDGSLYTVVTEEIESALYRYDIDGEVWEEISNFGEGGLFDMRLIFFGEANSKKAVIEEIRVSFWEQSSTLVLVDLANGETENLERLRGGVLFYATASPVVDEDSVYWIDPMTRSLVVHSFDDGKRETIELGYTTD